MKCMLLVAVLDLRKALVPEFGTWPMHHVRFYSSAGMRSMRVWLFRAIAVQKFQAYHGRSLHSCHVSVTTDVVEQSWPCDSHGQRH